MHCTGVPVHVMGGEEGGRGGVENAAAGLDPGQISFPFTSYLSCIGNDDESVEQLL